MLWSALLILSRKIKGTQWARAIAAAEAEFSKEC